MRRARRRAARPRARRRASAAYEERRERELAAPLAAMAAFCAEKSIALYFVTPYGPYFDLTDDELARMSVHHFLEEAARVHGSERAALGAEVELITRVVRRVAAARLRPRDRHAGGVTTLVAPDLARLHRGRGAPQPRGKRGPRQAHRDADPPWTCSGGPATATDRCCSTPSTSPPSSAP